MKWNPNQEGAVARVQPERKLKPEEVAAGTLDGVEAGEEDVFPGALSRGAADVFKDNPAAPQARMSMVVHAID